MRRFRELNVREREEFAWLTANEFLKNVHLDDGGDPVHLIPIIQGAARDPKTDVSPILDYVKREFDALHAILMRDREAFRKSRPVGYFRWRILLMVADCNKKRSRRLQLWGQDDVPEGPYLILGQRSSGPRDLQKELKVIRRAYEVVEQEDSPVERLRDRDVKVPRPESLTAILMDDFDMKRSTVRSLLKRYLFDLKA